MDISTIAKKVRTGEIEPVKIKLMSHQISHFNKIVNDILPYKEGYLDGTFTGRGKTIITAAVSLTYDMSLFVICPFTVIKVWKDAIDAFGLKCKEIMSYDRFAGKSNVKLSHDYLIKTRCGFEASEKLVNIILTEKILFVFDECQSIKNRDTIRFKACRVLTNTISSLKTSSRFAALSASPFDKVEYVIAILRLFGILLSHQLYTKRKDTHQVYLIGLQEVIDYARKIDPRKTRSITLNYHNDIQYSNITQNIVKLFAFDLYDQVIKNSIGSSIPNINLIDKELFQYEGYFNISNEDKEILLDNISILEDTISNKTLNINHLVIINKIRQLIEHTKINLFIRLAREKLSNPENKVILAMNFNDSIEKLNEALSEYNPLVLIGKTRNRNDVIDKFQSREGNRLLILNIKVGGLGINLHDIFGDRTRYLFISPNFSMINIFQMIGRIYRIGLKSDTYAYLVYGKGDEYRESHVIRILSSKLKPTKGSIPGYVDSNILFPGEYPKYIED